MDPLILGPSDGLQLERKPAPDREFAVPQDLRLDAVLAVVAQLGAPGHTVFELTRAARWASADIVGRACGSRGASRRVSGGKCSEGRRSRSTRSRFCTQPSAPNSGRHDQTSRGQIILPEAIPFVLGPLYGHISQHVRPRDRQLAVSENRSLPPNTLAVEEEFGGPGHIALLH